MVQDSWQGAFVRAASIERRLKPGQALFRDGERSVGTYQVVSGKVRLVRVDSSGREAVLYVATAGQILGEASLFSKTYHCDAIASGRSVVRLYPKDALLGEFRRDPDAAEAFMAMLAEQLMSLRTRLEIRNIRSARDRVLAYLVLNVGADRRTVTLPGTLKDLAGYLGLTHETLYRAVAELTADGDIRRSGNSITLRASRRS